jgi:hypothetical protein
MTANYTITIKTTNMISGQGSMTITWPSQVVWPGANQNFTCSVKTFRLFTSNCNVNNFTRTITITGVFDPSSTIPYSGIITVTLSPMINPADNRVINGFVIATFDDALQTYKIDKLDDNILVPQTLCNFPCKTCTANRTYCTSCWSDIGMPFLQASGN